MCVSILFQHLSNKLFIHLFSPDRLSGLILKVSSAVRIKKPATFMLEPILLHASKNAIASTNEMDNIHFLWLFGDEVRFMTYNSSIETPFSV